MRICRGSNGGGYGWDGLGGTPVGGICGGFNELGGWPVPVGGWPVGD
jgi:hypothetical protein